MTKQEHIKYWITTADKDWKAVSQLFSGKSYLQALFFSHLVLEKILKAHWIKDNKENHPPRIHNLLSLAYRTNLKLPEDDLKFLDRMNEFQLEGRYPDYTNSLYKKCNRKFTLEIITRSQEQRKCLLKML